MKKVRKISEKLPSLMQKKRVAAYARVSRDTQENAHSLAAQIDYYTKEIENNPEWENAGIYADFGISGTGTGKRTEFNRMIADADAGKIDLILTKSIQRFARNTVDLLSVVRHLKEKGVEVYFERERIYSLSSDGELMMTLIASFAQEESRSISENVKWSIRKEFEQGITHYHSRTYGYKWQDGIPVIVDDEAEIVRKIYQNFLDGKSRVQTAKDLNAEGIRTWKGNCWDEMAVRDILTNPIYAGNLLLQKSYIADHITHKKVRNHGHLPMYLVKENHQGIISQETFDLIQKEIADRQIDKIYCKNPHVLTKKIICGKCGCCFIYFKARDCWYCNSREVLGEACHSISIPDHIVKELACKTLNCGELTADKVKEINRIVVYENFSVEVVLKSGVASSYKWKRPKRCWTPETRERILQGRYAYRRKGEGRHNEFTSRIYGLETGEGFRRFLKPNKKEGKRAYWRGNGTSIKENELKEVVQTQMGWPEYKPEQVIEQIDRILISEKFVKLELFNGEALWQER